MCMTGRRTDKLEVGCLTISWSSANLNCPGGLKSGSSPNQLIIVRIRTALRFQPCGGPSLLLAGRDYTEVQALLAVDQLIKTNLTLSPRVVLISWSWVGSGPSKLRALEQCWFAINCCQGLSQDLSCRTVPVSWWSADHQQDQDCIRVAQCLPDPADNQLLVGCWGLHWSQLQIPVQSTLPHIQFKAWRKPANYYLYFG